MQILSEQEQGRRDSLQQLRELGIEPYPAEAFDASHYAANLLADFEAGKQVTLSGRMMSKRIMGKASFAELKDSTGRIQIYINRDVICPDEDKTLYNTVFKKLLDHGDFIGVEGKTFVTQTGEKIC